MHIDKSIATGKPVEAAAAYRRPVLRKRDIRSLRRLNHGLYN